MNDVDSAIESIVQTIWSTLVDMPLRAGGGVGGGDAPTVTGIVQIAGAWRGAVVVRCPFVLASMMTAAIFRSVGDPTFDEVSDALGELTNMVAGNVKALLPQPSAISLPTVAFGSQYEISVVGTRIVATVPFTAESHSFTVSLLQQSGNIGGAPDAE